MNNNGLRYEVGNVFFIDEKESNNLYEIIAIDEVNNNYVLECIEGCNNMRKRIIANIDTFAIEPIINVTQNEKFKTKKLYKNI